MHSCLPGQRFGYALEVKDEALIVALYGEASYDQVPNLYACTEAILDNFRALVVLDFSGLRYLGSLAFGALINLQRAITLRKGQLRLVRLRPEIEQLFAFSGLDKLFVLDGSSEPSVS